MLPRLMIIDDEEALRQALLDFFEDYDEFRLRAASCAEEALELLADEPADLCIVDMRLPSMNGQEFMQAANERGLCAKFLLHTGSIDMHLSDELRTLGLTPDDLFQKPCDSEAILARVRYRLQQG